MGDLSVRKYTIICFLSLAGCFATATAGAVPCVFGGLSGSVSCNNGGLGSNNDSVDELNASSYFGFDDWVFLQKQDTDPPETEIDFDIGLEIDPVASIKTGSWSISDDAFNWFEDILIVLKVGRASSENPIYWSAYLLDGVSTSGTWDTGRQGLSHISVYAREPQSIPEPSSLSIVIVGLFGMVVGRQVKKRLRLFD